MKVKMITLGCKVNQYESEAMLSSLLKNGFSAAQDGEPADVVVLNSCTVTAESDRKVRQVFRRAKKDNPDAVMVLSGCMAQAFPEDAKRLEEADIILGTSNRARLLPDLLAFLSARQRIIDIEPHTSGEAFERLQVDSFSGRTRAFVKIEDGCNRFCSYCIIPYARGRVRSKPLEDLRGELHALAANGFREVVLTGINLSAYGQEFGLHLCDAIEAACSVPGIERVRLGSLEPEQLSEDVIRRMAKQKKLCPQFHLSLQSGCDATLRRMNRHYTADEYRTIVRNLRAAFENAAVTTDIMVGFAGETNAEFEASLAFAKEIAFAKVHVFAYS
ncbi:MAG: tRNA (N(6)-L-threonylcarbamoyladenosine(37)-C(2))-methylthiotransferase MtaB, partial [Acutalibacteraceae bacterium]